MNMSRKNKSFEITNIIDALMVLGTLITASIPHIDKIEEYYKEANDLLEKYHKEEYIPGKEYEDLYDKYMYRQKMLFMYMADEAKDVFSYKKLRKELVNKEFITRDLDQEIYAILNELLVLRNSTFHNVQSNIIAEKEVLVNSISPELFHVITPHPQLNPLVVIKNKAYTKERLISFINYADFRNKMFSTILYEMSLDYQEMFDMLPMKERGIVIGSNLYQLVPGTTSMTPAVYEVHEEIGSLNKKIVDMANISMAIQKNQYRK